MNRVLFVDDERVLLDGLRGRLRSLRSAWEMKFVDSGEAALDELERVPYELVVADIRMPTLDGVQLLTMISERWPATMRVALSGYANQEQMLKLIPVVHQYLSKPCAPRVIESVLERCAALQLMLPVPQLRALVGGVRQLEPTPGTAAAILKLLDRLQAPEPAEVAKLISADTVIAAKVLQIVNSAFFRLAYPVSCIEQAVKYLGLPAIKSLIGANSVFPPAASANCPPEFDLRVLQAQASAMAASAASSGSRDSGTDEAIIAALLQNIGYWMLVQEAPDVLAGAAEHARREGLPLHLAEIATLGASHAQIGAYLLGLWGLPQAVVDAVLHHHSGEARWQDTMMVQALHLSEPGGQAEAQPGAAAGKVDATHSGRR